jgi:hypothetical protein
LTWQAEGFEPTVVDLLAGRGFFEAPDLSGWTNVHSVALTEDFGFEGSQCALFSSMSSGGGALNASIDTGPLTFRKIGAPITVRFKVVHEDATPQSLQFLCGVNQGDGVYVNRITVLPEGSGGTWRDYEVTLPTLGPVGGVQFSLGALSVQGDVSVLLDNVEVMIDYQTHWVEDPMPADSIFTPLPPSPGGATWTPIVPSNDVWS